MENLDVEMAEQIVKLKEENKVLKKALELACEEIDRNQGSLSEVAFDYFIDQAKESIDNE